MSRAPRTYDLVTAQTRQRAEQVVPGGTPSPTCPEVPTHVAFPMASRASSTPPPAGGSGSGSQTSRPAARSRPASARRRTTASSATLPLPWFWVIVVCRPSVEPVARPGSGLTGPAMTLTEDRSGVSCTGMTAACRRSCGRRPAPPGHALVAEHTDRRHRTSRSRPAPWIGLTITATTDRQTPVRSPVRAAAAAAGAGAAGWCRVVPGGRGGRGAVGGQGVSGGRVVPEGSGGGGVRRGGRS